MKDRLSTKHKLIYVRNAETSRRHTIPAPAKQYADISSGVLRREYRAYFCSLPVDKIGLYLIEPWVGDQHGRSYWMSKYQPNKDIFHGLVSPLAQLLEDSLQVIYFRGPFYLSSCHISPYELCKNWRAHRIPYVRTIGATPGDKRTPFSRRCYAGRTVNWFVNWVEACDGKYETEFDRQLGRLARSIT